MTISEIGKTSIRELTDFQLTRLRTSVTGTVQSSAFAHSNRSAKAVLPVLFDASCFLSRLSLEILRVHASVRGQRGGCQHDAGSM